MKFLCTLILSLAAAVASAAILNAPYGPELDLRFHRIEAMEGDVTLSIVNNSSLSSSIRPSVDNGLNFSRVAKAKFVLDGLGISSLSPTSTVTLPAKSLLIGGWLYNAVTIITSGIDPLVKFQCEDDANIAGAQLLTVTQGTVTGTSLARPFGAQTTTAGATQVKAIASACNILATISHGTFSQGTLDLYVEYVVTD